MYSPSLNVCHKSISAEQVFIVLIHCILPNHGGSGGRWEHHHHQCGWQRDHPIEARVVQRPRWQQVCIDVFWTLAKPTWCRRPYVCWLFTPSFCTIDRISSFSSRFRAWNACTCACGSSVSSGLDSHDACVFLPSTGASEGWDDTPRAAGLRMRSQVSLWSRIHYPRAGGATDLPPWGTGSSETSRARIAAQSARPYGGRLFNSRTGGRGIFSWTAEKCWVHTSGFLRRWIYLSAFATGGVHHSTAMSRWADASTSSGSWLPGRGFAACRTHTPRFFEWRLHICWAARGWIQTPRTQTLRADTSATYWGWVWSWGTDRGWVYTPAILRCWDQSSATATGWGYPQQLAQSGLTLQELLQAGFESSSLRIAGFTPEQFLDAGLTYQHLLECAGFTLQQLTRNGLTSRDLRRGGLSPQLFLQSGFTLPQLREEAGFDFKQLRYRLTLRQIKDCGFKAQAFLDEGLTLHKLREVGFTPGELRPATAHELLQAGFTLKEIANAKIPCPLSACVLGCWLWIRSWGFGWNRMSTRLISQRKKWSTFSCHPASWRGR